MSVFVESSHLFAGFARRAAALRHTGSTAGRWVKGANRSRWTAAGTRRTRSTSRQRGVRVSAMASMKVGSSSGVL